MINLHERLAQALAARNVRWAGSTDELATALLHDLRFPPMVDALLNARVVLRCVKHDGTDAHIDSILGTISLLDWTLEQVGAL